MHCTRMHKTRRGTHKSTHLPFIPDSLLLPDTLLLDLQRRNRCQHRTSSINVAGQQRQNYHLGWLSQRSSLSRPSSNPGSRVPRISTRHRTAKTRPGRGGALPILMRTPANGGIIPAVWQRQPISAPGIAQQERGAAAGKLPVPPFKLRDLPFIGLKMPLPSAPGTTVRAVSTESAHAQLACQGRRYRESKDENRESAHALYCNGRVAQWDARVARKGHVTLRVYPPDRGGHRDVRNVETDVSICIVAILATPAAAAGLLLHAVRVSTPI
eukprot:1637606-Rhodomonas_salina.1